jgi:hypothetical protein
VTELSDYKRMIEKPNLARLDRMIKNQAALIGQHQARAWDALIEAKQRGYREAIEAAARVAEEWLCGNCNTWSQEPRDCCARPDWSRQREPSETAQAIRALGEKADSES